MNDQFFDCDCPSIINGFFPKAVAVYEELERKAWHPERETPDFSERDRLAAKCDLVWVLQDIPSP